ncbi:Sec-independent protein translocase protein TatB [Emcibacter nanhaiensis]|uniref:Twin-arginine translocase subunit TatB n=1 Tax=Emcibacter nanhaiensis TaxID=1505037 RepID=A0A501PJF1_9PROT|nr:Sec-independent protein translocase protein TatB [Emcibacter nanhaiensis]TPD60168.1 twin-arginine translocase subunit TatB [Emcibacter nanhaiensis]
MFDIGAMEMMVVAVIAIVVIGPRDLPKALRAMGRFWGHVRDLKETVTDQVEELISQDEMAEIRKVREQAMAAKNLAQGKIDIADQNQSKTNNKV